MMKEIARKFREPFAWALLGYVTLTYLAALVRLIVGEKTIQDYQNGQPVYGARPFAARAFVESDTFLDLFLVALIVLAVLLVTQAGGKTTLARPVAFTALGLLGFTALLGLVTDIWALFAKEEFSVFSGRDKVEKILTDLPIFALIALSVLLVLALLRSEELKPAPKPIPQYGYSPYYPHPQQGQYGQQGESPWGPQQPAEQQWYGQPGYQPPGHQHPTQQYASQEYSSQQHYPSQQYPGQPYQSQQYPAQQHPGQPPTADKASGEPHSGEKPSDQQSSDEEHRTWQPPHDRPSPEHPPGQRG